MQRDFNENKTEQKNKHILKNEVNLAQVEHATSYKKFMLTLLGAPVSNIYKLLRESQADMKVTEELHINLYY